MGKKKNQKYAIDGSRKRISGAFVSRRRLE